MDCIEFWNEGINPITGYRFAWYDGKAKGIIKPVEYLKVSDFDSEKYVETKELMEKYNLKAYALTMIFKKHGFAKLKCFNRYWVDREIEKHLK